MSRRATSRPMTPPVHGSNRTETIALKIGVMGGATGAISQAHIHKAHELGRAIARSGSVLITGACPGLPLAAACGANQAGGMVVGISPALSLDEHVYKYNSPTEFHDVLIFTGSGLMGREVVNIRSSDMVLIIGGRSGTLGELAIAYDEGRLIGALTGTGGVSDLVADILVACDKDTGAHVVYDAAPRRLVKKLLHVYRTSHFRRPSCFCLDRPPGEDPASMPTASRDPVCGMQVVPEAAAAERAFDGQKYLFCSRACVKRFDAAPSKFAARPEDHV